MSQRLIPVIAFIFFLVSCHYSENKLSPTQLSVSKIPSQIYTIDQTRDTILLTKDGAIIKIPKGALQSASDEKIQLEIKEAYSITDIINGGLVTRTNGIPLSSGGMIYINAVAGKKVTITKPISISVPATYLRKEMELFKVVPDAGKNINWGEPVPIAENETIIDISRGEQMFLANCASCHAISKALTGPALAYITERRDWKWLKRFTINSEREIKSGARYARCLYESYNKTPMTNFPNLTDTELKQLYKYIENESKRVSPDSIYDFKKSFDSCKVYQKQKNKLESKRRKLIAANKGIDSPINPARNQSGTAQPEIDDNFVKPISAEPVYYQFTIEAFGWYNIDVLLKNLPGVENSDLAVRLTGAYKNVVNIYLIIPSEKVFLEGGALKAKNDEYGFYTDDGKIPLPQAAQAYIIAMGEYENQIVFGKADFIITRQQQLDVELSITTPEKMNAAVKKIGLKDLSIQAKNSQHAAEIKFTDQQLKDVEKIKPVFCNCDCGLYPTDTSGRSALSDYMMILPKK